MSLPAPKFVCCAIAALAIIPITPALAQQAGLQIALVDAESGSPVPDAEIIIDNRAIGLRRIVRSDDQGLVRIEAIPTGGRYLVSAPASDRYEAIVSEPLALRSNFARSVTLRVKPIGSNVIMFLVSTNGTDLML